MSDTPITTMEQAAKLADLAFPAEKALPATPSRDFIWHIARDAAMAAIHLMAPEGLSDREELILDIVSWKPGMFKDDGQWIEEVREKANAVARPPHLCEPSCGKCGSSNISFGQMNGVSVGGITAPAKAVWQCNACDWRVAADDSEDAKRQFEAGECVDGPA